ncbi:hypothetical protein PRK78_007070 [Emydomyces testavorans]|uniref:Uncharacterized protein n=1 Tax=Emydomyces testavorans TaxID=2070801 RepID=A0AAF0DNL7_9EURO|nr:hypothetical protein PRK78_007070 [Emydomyces testavorans]
MQFKSLAFLLLSATALATPEPQDVVEKLTSLAGSIPSAVSSDLAGLSSLLPPSSIASVLATAIPPSIRSSIQANPTAAIEFNSALHSSLKAGQTPTWYASLPQDVKDYLNRLGGITGTGANGPSATGTAGGSNGGTATSRNYAAHATGAVAATLAGAAGLLGLAFAL